MLKLDVDKCKQLTFEVQVGGIQPNQISSYLRVEIDNVEYGFPGKVVNDNIIVNLPPLKDIVNRRLKEDEEVEVKLEVVADGNQLTPWKDKFKFVNPLVVEAKIKDTSNITTKLISEKDTDIIPSKKLNKINEVTKPKTPKKESYKNLKQTLTKDHIFHYMESRGTRNKEIQNIIYEQACEKCESTQPFEVLKQVMKIIKK